MRPNARSSSTVVVDARQERRHARGGRARARPGCASMGLQHGVPGTRERSLGRVWQRACACSRLGGGGSVAPAPGAEHMQMEAARECERRQRGTRNCDRGRRMSSARV